MKRKILAFISLTILIALAWGRGVHAQALLLPLQSDFSEKVAIQPFIKQKPKPTPPKPLTEADNPQHCDESHQWIASEAPFYCIEKSYQDSSSSRTYVYSNYNTYDWGNCTWFVKNMRPDIPNDWHNAIDWLYNARSIGWPTGYTPKVGAVVWFNSGGWGHVAYLKRINSDGTLYILEMNVEGLGVESSRTINNSNIAFIY